MNSSVAMTFGDTNKKRNTIIPYREINTNRSVMDPLFIALSLYRRRKFEASAAICSEQLAKNAFDQAFWALKMQCLTRQIYVDDIEADEEGIAESVLSDEVIADVARPGTSLKTAGMTRITTTSQAVRPVTQSGRPITGVIRPGTQGGSESMEAALMAPRTAKTSRPMTSSSGRFVRLGTASMLSSGTDEGPFINIARLNIPKYAKNPCLARPLFEYILFHENDVRVALDLAAQTTQASNFNDWWWKLQLGKCYYKVGLLRDAETQFKSCLKHHEITVDPFLWLGKVYIRLDQPLSAIDVYKQGLDRFPTQLTLNLARVEEALNHGEEAVKLYRSVVKTDAMSVESIACIAMHHFYTDQPEIALRYYRRILQMNAPCSEVYNNLGLCCYFCQQFDLVITCFERALLYSDSDETTAEIWYNIGHVALGTGDKTLASQCFKLALVANNSHAESYNNLGVIESSKKNMPAAKSLFQSSASNGSHLYEPKYNMALVSEDLGNFDDAYRYVEEALTIFPTFYPAKELRDKLRKMYDAV